MEKIVGGAELFHAGERTDGHTIITNPIFLYRKFEKALQFTNKFF